MTRAIFTDRSPVTAEALLGLADAELSTRARMAHVALLVGSILMTIGIVSLWITEPSLPLRTHLAFGALAAIGVSWTVFAARVLTRRRVLYARHRVVAARMALTFTAVFTLGALAIGWTNGTPAGYVAAAMGGVLLAVAAALLVRARRKLASLMDRRRDLEKEMASGAASRLR